MIYPPQPSPELWALIRELATGERDEYGTPLLSRAPSDDERARVRERSVELSLWMKKGSFGELKNIIMRLLIDLGKERQAASTRADEIVKVLGVVPAWAVDRAADDFRVGRAGPEEVEDESFVPGSPPEPRHIAHRSRMILRPFQVEWEKIDKIIRGRPMGRVLSDDDRRVLGEKMRVTADEMIQRNRKVDAERRDRAAALFVQSSDLMREVEWLESGIEIPARDPKWSASLSLHLLLGGRIEEVNGDRFLTMPWGKENG